MKHLAYLRRSVKYLVWFCVIFIIVTCILILTTENGYTLVSAFDPENGMFKAGSLPKIILFFLAVSAVYPSFAFVRRDIFLHGSYEENREMIRRYLDSVGYELVEETPEEDVFRLRNRFTRFMRMYEDRITVERNASPVRMSGFRKDVFRIANGIEYQSRKAAEGE